MTKVTTQSITLERRTFLKLSAAAVLAGSVVDWETAWASETATPSTGLVGLIDEIATKPAADAGKDLLYWIDGPMNKGLMGASNYSGDLPTKARLACTMVMDHGQNNTYLESVTLVELSGGSKKVLQQVIHGSTVQTMTKRAPYTIFENLDLDIAKDYQLIFVKSVGSMVTIHQHTITEPEASRMDFRHLPYAANDSDMLQSFFLLLIKEVKENVYYFDNQETKRGFVTTPFGATFNEEQHSCRARVLSIDNTGGFRIDIEFMHPDDNTDAHYMRYFLVMDPVGRVLGAVRRIHGDGVSDTVEVRRGFHTPRHATLSPGITEIYQDARGKSYGRMHGSTLNGAIPEIVANSVDYQRYISNVNILDCPYVSIYTDDKKHAIARFTLRLR